MEVISIAFNLVLYLWAEFLGLEEVNRTFLKGSTIIQELVEVEDNNHLVDTYKQVVDSNIIDYSNPLALEVQPCNNLKVLVAYMIAIIVMVVNKVLS